MKKQNIINIPFEINFLQELAKSLIEKYADDPIYFANLTVLLPNRRSCRELTNLLFQTSDNESLLLPNIMPIGEINEDEIFFNSNLESENVLNVIPQMRQRLILTPLIESWKKKTDSKTFKAQSALLSIELSSFLDEVEKEQLSFDKIENLVPERFSEHWQLTLEFLKIATINWPDILTKYNAISSPNYLNYLLTAKSDYLQQHGSEHPIIIADSVSSIPAIRQLIKTVANIDNGHIYLHGLDQNLSDETWQNIEESHPQWQLKQLIEYLDVTRSQIQDFHSTKLTDRSNLVTNAMLPAENMVSNTENVKIKASAVENLQIVNCSDLYNESTIIAMKIRQALEENIGSIALITNNSTLTKLVGLELKRWNIDINDSTGMSLKDTPQAVFFSLIAKMICDNFNSPINILEALKHAFCNCGYPTIEFKKFVNKLESQCFRGIRKDCNLYSIKNYLDEETASWWQEIINIVKPISDIIYQNKYARIKFKDILHLHVQIVQAFANSDDESGDLRLYKHDKGIKFKEFIDELSLHADEIEEVDIKEYPALFGVMMEGVKYNPPYSSNSKIIALAPTETRLLKFDLVIMAGLNDNSWPNLNNSNPFMNKAMCNDFGLASTERNIGLQSHDFCNLLASDQVFITRSIKEDGVFTVKSRWLSRIETILKISNLNVDSSKKWQQWSKDLNKPDKFITPVRASANPPITARPRELSVTYFEKLIRDPYAIYANKILSLKKLDDIDQDPTMADFGSLIHQTFDKFIKQYNDDKHSDKYQELINIGDELAKKMGLNSHMFLFWQERFKKIAKWFALNESETRKQGVKILSEIDGKIILNFDAENFTIKARADRIEKNVDGSIAIIDYKTGILPAVKEVQNSYAPQMTLQGLIADKNGFNVSGDLQDLIYWKFSNDKNVQKRKIGYNKKYSLEQLISDTESNIYQLIEHMFFQNTPLIACPDSQKQPKFNEYKHLERI